MAETPDSLCQLLINHADDTSRENISNSLYAAAVRGKIEALKTLIDTQSGEVRSIISTWEKQARPIIETLFGTSLEGHRLGDFAEYSPTRFEGVCGRVRIISTDEIWGPALTVDLAGSKSLDSS